MRNEMEDGDERWEDDERWNSGNRGYPVVAVGCTVRVACGWMFNAIGGSSHCHSLELEVAAVRTPPNRYRHRCLSG